MNIHKDSPHLDGLLNRLMKKGSLKHRDYQLIDRAFAISMQHSGKEEIDFIREDGVSFNPRPARAALILIKDAKETSAVSIAAIVIASVYETTEDLEFDSAVLDLVKESLKDTTKIQSKSAALIACSLWLDRARHLHQIAEENREKVWPSFLEMHKNYLELANKHSSSLHILLDAWERRFRNQFCR